MDLYIYDGFTMLDVVDKFTSLRWRRRYHDCGEFELHVDDSLYNISLFAPGRQIVRPDSIETGVIEHISISPGDLSIRGRFLECWLYMGIIEDIYEKNEQYADSIRAWVSSYIIPERPGLLLGKTVEDTPLVRFQTSYKNVGENISKFAKAAEIGFRIRKDYKDRKYYFDLYRGTNHSAAQSANQKVYFSDEFCNLQNPNYEYDLTKYYNYALVMGEGEGSARERVVVDRRNPGEPKRAIYVNASNMSREEEVTLTEYRKQLQEQGDQKLSSYTPVELFEGDAVETPNFIYKNDYELGDIVTIESKQWGKASHQRITEIEEIYESNLAQVVPIFGNPAPESLDLEDLI